MDRISDSDSEDAGSIPAEATKIKLVFSDHILMGMQIKAEPPWDKLI